MNKLECFPVSVIHIFKQKTISCGEKYRIVVINHKKYFVWTSKIVIIINNVFT